MADTATHPDAVAGIGRFRTFGERGPLYEVLGVGKTDGTLAIRVVHSGEELDYQIDRALEDPEA